MRPKPLAYARCVRRLTTCALLLAALVGQAAGGDPAHAAPPQPVRAGAHPATVLSAPARRRAAPEAPRPRALLERVTGRGRNTASPAGVVHTRSDGPEATLFRGLDERPPKVKALALKALLDRLGIPPVRDGAVRFASLDRAEGRPDVDLYAGPFRETEGDRTYLGAKVAVRW